MTLLRSFALPGSDRSMGKLPLQGRSAAEALSDKEVATAAKRIDRYPLLPIPPAATALHCEPRTQCSLAGKVGRWLRKMSPLNARLLSRRFYEAAHTRDAAPVRIVQWRHLSLEWCKPFDTEAACLGKWSRAVPLRALLRNTRPKAKSASLSRRQWLPTVGTRLLQHVGSGDESSTEK
ncbi:hypothetical protein MRX96_029280 [Rhipicephalus microplus]